MELKILDKIGDLLDLDKEYEYPCSDGSVIHTIDCRPVARAQAKLTVKQIMEWGDKPCDKHNILPFPGELGGGTITRKGMKRRRCPKCWGELEETF